MIFFCQTSFCLSFSCPFAPFRGHSVSYFPVLNFPVSPFVVFFSAKIRVNSCPFAVSTHLSVPSVCSVLNLCHICVHLWLTLFVFPVVIVLVISFRTFISRFSLLLFFCPHLFA